MLEKGTVISKRYQIIEKLGSGGMAVAYKARDMRLGRFVTIKVLKDEYAENEEFLTKFSSEASAAASLSHHNIVRVFDVGRDKNINYIVMEYVHGQSLKKTIQEKAPFDTLTTLSVAMQIASALSHAHQHHVVHRDIKPQNILVAVDGTVKVTDFGIARAATTNTYAADVNAMGSVHYFSPEQARGGFVNEKSDIYSLGITMFEMATGRVPFDASSSIAIALKHLNEELPDIKQYNPNVTRGLEGIIRKATQKKADERYDNIDLLISDLKLAIIEAARVAKNNKANEKKNSQEIQLTEFKSNAEKRAERRKVSRAAEAAAAAAAAANELSDAAAEELAENQLDEENMEDQLSLDDLGVSTGESHPKYEEATLEEASLEDGSFDEDEYEDYEEVSEDEWEEEYEDEEPEEEKDGLKVELAKDIKLPKSSVGFGKYSKKLKLNDENDYYDDDYDDDDDDDDYYDEEFDDYYKEIDEEKRQERKVTIAAVITSLIIIGIIVFVGVRFFNVFDNVAAVLNKTETVPNFVGMTMTEATETAEELGITLVEGGVVDSIEEKDTILSQDIDEGTDVTENMEIIVTVSSGEGVYPMPNVIGEEESTAISTITSQFDANIIIEYEYSETETEGTVISQSPEADSYVSDNVDVILTICRDQDNINAVVPNVTGYTEVEAKEKIESAGLTVGNISYTTSTTVSQGYVITQTADPGEEILKNSSIDIVVSTGRPVTQTTTTTSSNETTSNNTSSGTNSDTSSDTQTSTNVDDDVPVLGSEG